VGQTADRPCEGPSCGGGLASGTEAQRGDKCAHGGGGLQAERSGANVWCSMDPGWQLLAEHGARAASPAAHARMECTLVPPRTACCEPQPTVQAVRPVSAPQRPCRLVLPSGGNRRLAHMWLCGVCRQLVDGGGAGQVAGLRRGGEARRAHRGGAVSAAVVHLKPLQRLLRGRRVAVTAGGCDFATAGALPRGGKETVRLVASGCGLRCRLPVAGGSGACPARKGFTCIFL
jgi:hypothetical protein